jgi:hypothetical protein
MLKPLQGFGVKKCLHFNKVTSVYNLFFNCKMESKIGEANTHPPAGGSFSVGVKIFSWVFHFLIRFKISLLIPSASLS